MPGTWSIERARRAAGERRSERRARRPARVTAAGLLVVAGACLIAAGCGGQPAKLSEGSHQVARAASTGLGRPAAPARSSPGTPPMTRTETPRARPLAPRCARGAVSVGSAGVAFAAVVAAPTAVRAAPGAGALVTRLARLDVNGLPTVVAVTRAVVGSGCSPRWYRVRLSVVPNGTSGWVAAASVRLYRVASRIVVDLGSRSLRLYRAGRLVLRARVGIGAPGTPTPTGSFFVNERYVLSSPDGPFGPAALGISAHSVVLERSWVEDGPIALHGTNEPWSIGEAASHGCIHLANGVMRRVFALAPDGTPVIIER